MVNNFHSTEQDQEHSTSTVYRLDMDKVMAASAKLPILNSVLFMYVELWKGYGIDVVTLVLWYHNHWHATLHHIPGICYTITAAAPY